MSARFAFDDENDIVTINGARFNGPGLMFFTSTTDLNRWFRLERQGDTMIVHTRFDPSQE